MLQQVCPITCNEKLTEQFYHLSFTSASLARELVCGQFVFIRINPGYEPLLRRPFSVAWVLGGDVHLVYKVVGTGTTILATKKTGDVLDVMGPIGNGFTFHDDHDTILVAGGIGIASLMSLMKMCVPKRARLFYGARTKDEFIAERFLALPKESITYVTEDGSYGQKGYVTDALREYVAHLSGAQPYLYACGPLAMLRALVPLARAAGIPGEANLEERMACGVGACLGCAVETAAGMQMVCKDGPVFSFEELGW